MFQEIVKCYPSPRFIRYLYTILNNPEHGRYICWHPNGDSFMIIDPIGFGKLVLPFYFKHSNMSSFIRQLNKYGFKKIAAENSHLSQYGDVITEFRHPFFTRDGENIHLIRSKSNQNKKDIESRRIMDLFDVVIGHLRILFKEINGIKISIKRMEANHKNLNILLGPMESILEKYITDILKNMNCLVYVSKNMNEIYEFLRERTVEILFIVDDMKIVPQNINQLKKLGNNLTIILLADEGDSNRENIFKDVGVSEIIIRPYNREIIQNVIVNYKK